MTSNKLMDLIYDKLADNNEQEQFDHHENTDNKAMVNDWQNGGEPLIAFTYGDKEYVLSIKVNGPSEWQVFNYDNGFGVGAEHE